ncbi:MAG: orotate phosphoribosyltransferase [Cucumibacter sp.]
MTTDEVLAIFRQCGAILEGHFILSSGLHSPLFFQKALVFMHPGETEILCRALAAKIRVAEVHGIRAYEHGITTVVAPAVGGIIVGYETARHLGIPAIYTERVDGIFQLRRGFSLANGEKVIVVEDVVTTGVSIRECIKCIKDLGADPVAAACLLDRSAGEADIGIPLISLAELRVPAYPSDALPPALAAIPAVKPGSRGLS